MLNMTIEIVDFPIENGGSFHSYVSFSIVTLVYQRVTSNLGLVHGEEIPHNLIYVNRNHLIARGAHPKML